jgi:hypothetical protein
MTDKEFSELFDALWQEVPSIEHKKQANGGHLDTYCINPQNPVCKSHRSQAKIIKPQEVHYTQG